MKKNIDLLRKTKEALLTNPSKHRQQSWIDFDDYGSANMCHTTMCSAGHAAVSAGAEVPNFGQFLDNGWYLDEDGKLALYGMGSHVSEWAKEALGFNMYEEDYIFMCMDKTVLIKRMDQLIELWEQGKEMNGFTPRIKEECDD
jgi:hypothetical protein